MDKDVKITAASPYDSASWFSKTFFVWLIPMFKLGNSKTLELEDLHKPPINDQPRLVSTQLEKHWQDELKRKNPSVFRALYKTFGFWYMLIGQVNTLNECVLRILQPLMVGYVVRFFAKPKELQADFKSSANWAVFVICISSTIFSMSKNHWFVYMQRCGIRARVALMILIHKKIMRLAKSSFEKTSVGQILNILANDLNRCEELSFQFPYFITAPLQVFVAIYIMWGYLHYACLGGMAILGLMGRLFTRFRTKTSRLTDKRVKLMNELISAMMLIKVYCWETPFAEQTHQVRREEVKTIRWTSVLKGINLSISFVATRIMLFASFVVHIFLGGRLDAETVFVVMALFNTLRIPLTSQLPQAIGTFAETLVAMRRIKNLLMLEEKAETVVDHREPCGKVSFRNYSAKWSKTQPNESLKDINIEIAPGKLLIITGPVGSGKTCALYALLKEVEPVSGSCRLGGKTSYAPQESWCFGGTVRENILLGADYDEKRYNEVVNVTGLERDLQLFPSGDLTLVGEKGYTLSGGQKARVTLARAVYNEADVYLLDDPLSAVDPAVANHIFRKCINGFLKDKTVILVTHQLQFLKDADLIVLLSEGSVMTSGTFEELMAHDYLSFLSSVEKEEQERKQSLKALTSNELADEKRRQAEQKAFAERQSANKATTKDEERKAGSVEGSVYWTYFTTAVNGPFVFFVVAISLISQGIFHYNDFWISAWTEEYKETLSHNDSGIISQTSVEPKTASIGEEMHNVIFYSVLTLLLFGTALMRTTSIFFMCLRSSVTLHNRIFQRVLAAPLLFFETNPTGRILNRFTRDIGYVDQVIPGTMVDLSLTLLNTLGIMVTSAVVSPWNIIPGFLLLAASLPFRKIYLRTGRDVKRLDATTKSNVYSHVSTCFDGLTTIRAFGLQDRFIEQYLRYMEDSTACTYASLMAQRGIAFVLDGFAIVYICSVSILLVVFPGEIPGGNAGIVLSSALLLIGMFQYGVRQTAEFETQMVSVERILEYDRLNSEAALNSPDPNKYKSWPSKGAIEMRNVTLRYSPDTKAVLRSINLSIEGGEKVGIVGRTGAGKSSLISLIFRLVEPEGTVLIDGVDTQKLGLHDLRGKISIIPQDPILFSGQVRRNLDPFGEYDDQRLWQCLGAANLDKTIKDMPGELDALITEGGSNLSVGQRQLLCLARALLKNNKILVLDEATANVDHETDELIQHTIKTKFTDCTVLTVAHRLNTIIDMDKVLVLDDGRVMEFGPPYLLLKSRGHFHEMVNQTGTQMSNFLHATAEGCYRKKHTLHEIDD